MQDFASVIAGQVPVDQRFACNPGQWLDASDWHGIRPLLAYRVATQQCPGLRDSAVGRTLRRELFRIASALKAMGASDGSLMRSFLYQGLIIGIVVAVVAAAGGVGDGRGLAAALMLGADGVLVGTRFISSKESEAPEGFRQAIIRARIKPNSTPRSTSPLSVIVTSACQS